MVEKIIETENNIFDDKIEKHWLVYLNFSGEPNIECFPVIFLSERD